MFNGIPIQLFNRYSLMSSVTSFKVKGQRRLPKGSTTLDAIEKAFDIFILAAVSSP